MLLMRPPPLIPLTVEKSCYGVVNEPVSYFRNPSFPIADSVQNYCTYNAQVQPASKSDVKWLFMIFSIGFR